MHRGEFRRPRGCEPALCRRPARTHHPQSRRIRSFGLEARDRSRADRLATAKARPQSQDMSIVRYGSIAARYRARLYHDVGDHSARRAPTKLRRRRNLRSETDATGSVPRRLSPSGKRSVAQSLYLLLGGSTALVAPIGAASRWRRPCNSYSSSWPWRRPCCWTVAPAKLTNAHRRRVRVGATHLFTIAACELVTSACRK